VRPRALLCPLLIAGCMNNAAMPAQSVFGAWGGRHVGLFLTETGGTLDYDCAAGRIDGPLVFDGPHFTATGSHTPAMGGPDRVGERRPSFPARYSGTIVGNRMSLRVEVPAQGLVIGPLTLERGIAPQLMRCV